MTVIREDDFIQSVADALQFISYYHPIDYIEHLGRAYEREQSPAAKDAIAQILTNSRMCAEGHRPICQDTGIVNVFLKVGMDVRWDDEAQRGRHGQRGRAPRLPESRTTGCAPRSSTTRRSRAGTPATTRPAVIHVELVPGDTGRGDGRGQGRRFGEQVQVRDAESQPTRSSTGC